MTRLLQIGLDGRTCSSCRYWYALAFECRFGPPTLVPADREPGARDRAAFPPRDPNDVACGEWTAARTESQPSEETAILAAVNAGAREARLAGGRR